MRLRPVLRLLLAGLLALLTPVPLTLNPSFDPGPLTLDPPSARADGPGDWPMFRHDPAHTGYNPEETQLKPPLRLKWTYTTGESVDLSSPAVANGVVYVGSDDGKLYALEAATGALRWSYRTAGTVYSSPAVANGVVYVGSHDGKVYALDAATGALRWTYTTGGSVYSSPAVANGAVFVGSLDGKVYAFEAQPPPVSLASAAYQNAASFPISWTVPITWTGVAAASYDVQHRDGPSGAWTDVVTSTTSTSATFSGQDGHTYGFRARSRTATGAIGDWSEAVSTTVDLTAPTGSISLAGGATYATNPVTLTLAASDATSGVSQMALSDDGAAWENWQDYAASKSRTLPGPDGPQGGLREV